MTLHKNIGLIDFGTSEQFVNHAQSSRLNWNQIKKALVQDETYANILKTNYPHVEIVENQKSILDDHAINLVIFAEPDLDDHNMVAEAMNAGKHVQLF